MAIRLLPLLIIAVLLPLKCLGAVEPCSTYTSTADSAVSGTSSTFATCETDCSSSVDCIGYSIDATTYCYHRMSSQNPAQLVAAPGYTYYAKDPNVCQCYYSKSSVNSGNLAPESGTGSTAQASGTTLALCQALCTGASPTTANKECVGFNFNTDTTVSPQCYTYTADVKLTNTVGTTATTTTYWKDNMCWQTPTSYCTTFTLTPNAVVSSSPTSASINKLDECMDKCQTDSTCKSFHFSSSGDCFTSTGTGFTPGAIGSLFYLKYTGPCSCTYAASTNVRNAIGTEHSSITSETDCQNICTPLASCIGVSYDTSGSQKCWTFSSEDKLSTTPDSAWRTSLKDEAACSCLYTVEDQTQSSGKQVTTPTITTALQCSQQCGSTCQAYTWGSFSNPTLQYCSTVDNGQPLNLIASSPGYTTYTKQAGTCTPTATSCTYTNAPGISNSGSVQQAAKTQELCEAICTNDAACTAYVFNTQSQVCDTLVQTSTITNTPVTDATTYRKKPDCFCDYNPKTGVWTQGTSHSGKNTKDLCQAVCTSAPTCTAFVTGSGGECFTLTATTTLQDNVLTGWNTYIKMAKCYEVIDTCNYETNTNIASPGTSITTADTAATCEAMCTNAKEKCTGYVWTASDTKSCKNMGPADKLGTTATTGTNTYTKKTDCSCTYSELIDTNLNGVDQPSIRSRADCAKLCTPDTNCVAYVFNAKLSKCIINTAPMPYATTSGQTDYTVYTKQPTCYEQPANTCKYSAIVSTFNSGTVHASTTSQSACEKICTDDNTCVGYVFSTTNQCQTMTASNTPVNRNDPTYTTYMKSTYCLCTYVRYINAYNLGTNAPSTVKTSSSTACQEYCSLLKSCTGYVMTNTNQCQTLTTTAITTIPTTVPSQQGYITWVKDPKCTTLPAVCNYDPQNVVSSGTTRNEATTTDNCKYLCSAEFSCTAYTFFGTTCQTLTAANVIGTTPGTSTTHVKKQDCSCTYTDKADTLNIGTRQTSLTTAAACAAYCTPLTSCTGYVWAPGNQCYTLDVTTKIDDIVQADWTTSIKNNNCFPPDSAPAVCTYKTTGSTDIPTATLQTGVLTSADCQTKCTSDKNCISYVWITSPTQCKHWTSKTTPTTSPSSVATTYDKNQDCFCFYDSSAGFTAAGSPQSTVTTQKACEILCTQTTSCNSYVFDTATNACLTRSASNTAGGSARPTSTIYTKKASCSSQTEICNYNTSPGISNTGTSQSGITSQSQCEARCTPLDTCIGYVYNSNSGTATPCQTLTASNTLTNTPATNVNTYMKSAACLCTYTQETSVRVLSTSSSSVTMAACKNTCSNNIQCRGYTYGSNSNTCYEHRSDPTSWSKQQGQTGFDTYTKKATCVQPTGSCFTTSPNTDVQGLTTPTAGLTTQLMCDSQCNSTATCYGYVWKNNGCYLSSSPTMNTIFATGYTFYKKLAKCIVSCFQQTAGSGINGLPIAPGVTTQTQCEQNCKGDATCLGYVWTGTQCMYSTTASPVLVALPGSSYYRKGPNCGTPAAVCYRETPSLWFNGGLVQSGVSTQQACESACNAQSSNGCNKYLITQTTTVFSCTIFTTASPATNSQASPSSKVYDATSCTSTTCTYSVTAGTMIIGSPSAQTTRAACEALCTPVQTCTGYSYNAPSCQTLTAANVATVPDNAWNTYRKSPTCHATPPPPCAYTTRTGQTISSPQSANIQSTAKTETSCKDICTKDTNCQAYVFSGSIDLCMTVPKTITLSTTANTAYNTYIKSANCGAAPSGNCTYTSMADTFNIGSKAPASKTKAVCESECTPDPNCPGYAYTASSSTCYILDKAVPLNNLPNQGTTTYMKGQNCTACNYTQDSTKYSTEGTQQAGITTQQACAAACTASKTCASYLFGGTTTKSCSLINAGVTLLPTPVSGFSVWTKDAACRPKDPCQPPYRVYTGQSMSVTGTVQTGSQTQTQCEAACKANKGCAAYTYNTGVNTNQCSLYTNTLDVTKITATPGSNLGIVVPNCVASCNGGFGTVQAGKMIGNPQNQGGITTRAACESHCATDAGCGAYTFVNNLCFTTEFNNAGLSMTDANNANSYRKTITCEVQNCTYNKLQDTYNRGDLKSFTTVDACEKNCTSTPTCGGYAYTHTGTTTTSITCFHLAPNPQPQNSNAASWVSAWKNANCGATPPSQCQYTEQQNRFTDGTIQFSAKSAQACEAICTPDADCQAYVFGQSVCQTIPKGKTLSNADQPNYIRYVKQQSTCPGAACPPYVVTKNNYMQGTIEPSLTTLQACQQNCTNTPSCGGFAIFGRVCSILPSGATLTVNTVNNWDTHLKNPACGQQTACVTYTSEADQSIPGGTTYALGSTAATCQQGCTQTSGCLAAVYRPTRGTTPFVCNLITDRKSVSQMVASPGVTSYLKINNCPVACTYQTQTNTLIPNTITQSGVNSVAECKDRCNPVLGCVAYMWGQQGSTGTCFISVSESDVGQAIRSSSFTSYIRDTCPGLPCQVYTPRIDTRLPNGIPKLGANTEASCVTQCTATPGCVAFYFIPAAAGIKCYVNVQAGDISSPTPVRGTTTYVLQDKCDGSKCSYTSMANKFMSGNTPVRQANSMASCSNACTNDIDCLAYMWAPIFPNPCYTYTTIVGTSTFQGATIYTKDDPNCSRTSSCTATYDEETDQIIFDGDPHATVKTQTECEAKCTGVATCLAYSFIAPLTVKCYTITTLKPAQVLIGAKTMTKLTDSCAPPPTACAVQYTTVTGKHTYPNTPHQTILTDPLCKAECDRAASCKGYVYISELSVKCYTFNTTQTTQVSLQSAISYTKDTSSNAACCQSTWSNPTAQTMSGGTPALAATTSDDCRQICNDQPACVAYVWSSSCTTYTTLGSLSSSTTSQYFRKLSSTCAPATPTPPACTVTYSSQVNSLMTSGNGQTSATTTEACKSLCDGDSQCVAYMFGTIISPNCQTFTALSSVQSGITGVNVYTKTSDTCQQCRTEFAPQADTFIAGGTAIQSATTQAICETQCLSNPDCLSFNYGAGLSPPCQIITNPLLMVTVQTAPSITTYYRQYTCPVCQGTFSMKRNTKAQNGMVDPTRQTRASCEEKCKNMQNCVGYEWGTVFTFKCFIHTSVVDLGNEIPFQGVNLYVFNSPCVDTPACPITYATQTGTYYLAGIQFSQHTTKAACQNECSTDKSCILYSWAPTFPVKCYIHTNPNSLQSPEQSNLIDSFAKSEDCPVCQYTPTSGVMGDGGLAQPLGYTQVQCQAKCDQESGCVGFSFVTGSPISCYIHLRQDALTSTQSFPASTLYAKPTNCNSPSTTTAPPVSDCSNPYTLRRDTVGQGGIAQATNINLADCQDICTRFTQCLGFSYGRRPFQTTLCFIHTNAANITNALNQAGQALYVKKNNCFDDCSDPYNVTVDRYASGGVRSPPGTSASACRRTCDNNPACLGYDYLPPFTTTCVTHENAADYNSLSQWTGVAMYRKKPGCATRTCVDTFTRTVNVHSPTGGDAAPSSVNTQPLCQEYCLNYTPSRCVGYNFDNSQKLCFVFRDVAMLTATQPKDGVSNYVRVPCST